MKKFNLILIFALLLALLLCGCAGKGSEPETKEQTDAGQSESDKETEQDSTGEDKAGESSEGQQQPESKEDVFAGNDAAENGKNKKEDGGTATALNPDTVIYAEEEVVTTSSVNVRKAPSTDSEVFQTVARRSEFTRTANDGTWSAVTIDGKEYYIASEFLMLASEVKDNGYLVVIDAGHQAHGSSDLEPIGPGASEMKPRVASGTTGCVTGLKEYELTLMVSLKLQAELETRGYEVKMVRTSHDVDLSNSDRAGVANNAGADAFIRVHANGSDDSGQNGALTICPTSANPYMGNLYNECRNLSECVLDGVVNATGANRQSIWETDSMSGINWCTVPVTIVEMGFMTNPTEDQNMADEDYQQKLAVGMADGLDDYFGI